MPKKKKLSKKRQKKTNFIKPCQHCFNLGYDYSSRDRRCLYCTSWKEKNSIWKNIEFTFWDIYHKIVNFLDDIKYTWQRARRGYSYRDTWDPTYFLCDKLDLMLHDTLNSRRGVPMDYVDLAKDDVDKGAELYKKDLVEMMEGFRSYMKLMNEIPLCNCTTKKLQAKVKRGFKLLAKNVYNLGN